jgi:hypothetical protein
MTRSNHWPATGTRRACKIKYRCTELSTASCLPRPFCKAIHPVLQNSDYQHTAPHGNRSMTARLAPTRHTLSLLVCGYHHRAWYVRGHASNGHALSQPRCTGSHYSERMLPFLFSHCKDSETGRSTPPWPVSSCPPGRSFLRCVCLVHCGSWKCFL